MSDTKAQRALLVKTRHILEATACQLFREKMEAFTSSALRVMECLKNGFEEVIDVLCLPERYRKRLRSTNSVERLNEAIRRREPIHTLVDEVIRIFPNRDSATRLLGGFLMEFYELLTTAEIYLEMMGFNSRIDFKKQKRICTLKWT